MKILIKKPLYFSLKNTVMAHGWVYLLPYNWDGSALYGALSVNNDAFDFNISEKGKNISIDLVGRTSIYSEDDFIPIFRYALSLDFPIEDFIGLCTARKNDKLKDMAKAGWGRLLRSTSAWEDAVKTLFTTNCTWENTQRMTLNLCETFGERTKSGKSAFPSAKKLVKGNARLKEVRIGYREKYLSELAEKVANGDISLDSCQSSSGRSREEVERDIKSLKGFGDYAANHLLMLYGWTDFLPIDREVMKYLNLKPLKHGEIPKNIEHYSEYGKFRFTAYKLERIIRRRNWIGD